MIRVDKTGHIAPNILTNEGVTKRNEYIADYGLAPAGYALNTRARTKFEFDPDIYGHDDVKTLLKKIQGHKCCFCEAKVDHIAHGDIEHFRPKSGFKQDENTNIQYPGYYWLSYEWSNLYFSCQICNQREKGNYFPLEDNDQRADPVHRDISAEDPQFIDPGGSGQLDPERHIYFIAEIPTHQSKKGRITIKYLGLDRDELNTHRESALNRLRSLEKVVQLTRDSVNADEARQEFLNALRDCVSTSSEYSNMFKSNFSKYLVEL